MRLLLASALQFDVEDSRMTDVVGSCNQDSRRGTVRMNTRAVEKTQWRWLLKLGLSLWSYVIS